MVLKIVPWAFGRNRACGPIAVRGPLLKEPNCPDPVAQTVEDILWEIIGYGVPSEPVASTASLGRQRCPKCRALATVQNVVPIRAGFEYLTLRCTSCGLVFGAQIHTDPPKADAQGWSDSELVPPK